MASIPAAYHGLLQAPALAYLATLGPDGAPQSKIAARPPPGGPAAARKLMKSGPRR